MSPVKSLPAKLVVLVSGGGSTLEFLHQAIVAGKLEAQISAVFADRPCAALERAAIAGLPCELFSRKALGRTGLDQALAQALAQLQERGDADLVLAAGYLSVIGLQVLSGSLAREGRIWNMHPSLLPQYGGMGMYGIHVHRAVWQAGETSTGATLHQVSAQVDGGTILAQRSVDITDCHSPEQIAQRVQALEKQMLLEYLQSYTNWGN